MPGPDPAIGFKIMQRFKDLGFVATDAKAIRQRLDTAGGPRPGETLANAAFRIAKAMAEEGYTRGTAQSSGEQPQASDNRDDELIEVTFSTKIRRRDFRDLIARAA